MLDWGGHFYFDPHSQEAFQYAVLLLGCQQFGSAVAHLKRAGMQVCAAHLGVVCVYYGLISPQQQLLDEMQLDTRYIARSQTPGPLSDTSNPDCRATQAPRGPSFAQFVETYALTPSPHLDSKADLQVSTHPPLLIVYLSMYFLSIHVLSTLPIPYPLSLFCFGQSNH